MQSFQDMRLMWTGESDFRSSESCLECRSLSKQRGRVAEYVGVAVMYDRNLLTPRKEYGRDIIRTILAQVLV